MLLNDIYVNIFVQINKNDYINFVISDNNSYKIMSQNNIKKIKFDTRFKQFLNLSFLMIQDN